MNLAIRGIDGNLGPEHADSFHRDLHPDLKADYVLANPPFNDSDWRGELLREDKRWQFGTPSTSNANYAWVQHFIYHLAPTGLAGFVLANGSMSSNQSGEGEIRKNIIEADLVDCMVALPGQLFYSTQIPVCLWFIARDKRDDRFRDRRGEILFIDARKLGSMTDRVHRELTDEDIRRIADTYHAWRGDSIPDPQSAIANYTDVPGFCKAATLDDVRANGYVLTPGRYVGAEEIEDDGEPFDEKMAGLAAQLAEQFAEGARLEAAIRENLRWLGRDRQSLAPLGRSVEHKAVRLHDLIGEHALRQRRSIEMQGRVRRLLQRVGMPGRRKHGDNPFLGEQLAHLLHRADQIAVGREDQRHIEPIREGIGEHLRGDVDIGHLLVVSGVRVPALPADDRVGEVVPVVDGEILQGAERLQIGGLAPVLIQGRRDERGEILGLDQRLVGFQEMQSHLAEIQPVEALPAAGAQPVVQVEAIDVCDDAWHRPLSS